MLHWQRDDFIIRYRVKYTSIPTVFTNKFSDEIFVFIILGIAVSCKSFANEYQNNIEINKNHSSFLWLYKYSIGQILIILQT